MCNLLLPLCPFILQHFEPSTSRCRLPTGTNTTSSSTKADAKLLFTFIARDPSDTGIDPPPPSNSSLSSTHLLKPSRSRPYPPTPQVPKHTLYHRTNWHTCPCFFHRVQIIHPVSGPPHRAALLQTGGSKCERCTAAARLLKPMRMGGIKDLSTRGAEGFWNHCMFLGKDRVFGPPVGAGRIVGREVRFRYSVRAGMGAEQRVQVPKLHGKGDDDYEEERRRRRGDLVFERNWKSDYHEEVALRKERSGKFERDLDRYLYDTYVEGET